MAAYEINVSEIEDLQMTNDKTALEQIFSRAKSTVIEGGSIILSRKYANGHMDKFDELTSESDLENYRQSVFKYLA